MLMATTMTTCNARVDVRLSLVRVRPVSSGRQCIPSKLSFLGGGSYSRYVVVVRVLSAGRLTATSPPAASRSTHFA